MPMDQNFTKFLFCLLHFHLVDDSIINIISSLFLCSVLFIFKQNCSDKNNIDQYLQTPWCVLVAVPR